MRDCAESASRLQRASSARIGTPRFNFRDWSYHSDYERMERERVGAEEETTIALALKEHLAPGDSIVYGTIGRLGYYSGLKIHDRFGLVDRRVARHHSRDASLTAGHDIRANPDFFFDDVPTVLLAEIVESSPPIRPGWTHEGSIRLRVEARAQAWRGNPVRLRYVPEVLPLKPLPGGSPRVLLILRLIEDEPPYIATLPRPERVAYRKRIARKVWADFYASLDGG